MLFQFNYFGSPLRTWWKARKYFKFPDISFNFIFAYSISQVRKDENFDKLTDYLKPKLYNFFGKIFYITRNAINIYANPDYVGKLLDIYISDVLWKSKYNSPRHEGNPIINIVLFNLFCFRITFGKYYDSIELKREDESMIYYEYMLDYLYFRKSLEIDGYWEHDSKIYDRKVFTPTPYFSLNKKGKKEFLKLSKIKKNDCSI